MSKLKQFRQQAGLTQEELSAACGWEGAGRICNYESGRRTPGIHNLKLIRDALRSNKVKVSLEDLIEDQPNQQTA